MKKFLIFMLSLTMIISLSACNKSKNTSEESQDTAVEEVKEEPHDVLAGMTWEYVEAIHRGEDAQLPDGTMIHDGDVIPNEPGCISLIFHNDGTVSQVNKSGEVELEGTYSVTADNKLVSEIMGSGPFTIDGDTVKFEKEGAGSEIISSKTYKITDRKFE